MDIVLMTILSVIATLIAGIFTTKNMFLSIILVIADAIAFFVLLTVAVTLGIV